MRSASPVTTPGERFVELSVRSSRTSGEVGRADDAAASDLDCSASSETGSPPPAAAAGREMSIDSIISRDLKPRHKNLLTLVLALANAADAVEVLAVGFFLTVYRNEDGSPLSSSQKELLTGSIYLGMLFGGVVGGWVSDVIGRRITLIVSLAINATAGVLSALAPSLGWLSFLRVCAGVGVGASVPCLFTLGAELFPVDSRGLHLSYVASFWMVGSIYAAVAAWIILGNNGEGERILPGWTWRSYVVVAAAPVFITLALVIGIMPESPRYLLGKQKYHEVAKMLSNLTGQPISVESIMCQEAEPLNESMGDEEVIGVLARFGSLFSPTLLATTLRLTVIWFTLCFGTYGLNTWISTIFHDIGIQNEFLPTFLFALANGPGNLASFFLIEVIGRKRLLAYSMLLAAASGFLFAFAQGHGSDWVAVLAACLFQAFSVAGWNSLDALSTESFPTVSRTTGMGLLSGTGRLASLVAMVVNSRLETNIFLLFAVTGSMTLLGALASFCLPYEPAGKSLDGFQTVSARYRSFRPVLAMEDA